MTAFFQCILLPVSTSGYNSFIKPTEEYKNKTQYFYIYYFFKRDNVQIKHHSMY